MPETPLLAGRPIRKRPFAGEIVHPAGVHEGEALLHGVGPEDALAGEGADAAARERRGNGGDDLDVDLEGAALDVELECLDQVGPLREGVVLAHEVAEGEVAVGGASLGEVRGVVEPGAGAAGEPLPDVNDMIEAVREVEIRADHGPAHDGAGIEHRVVRTPLGIERDLIEALAAGLAPDTFVHGLLPILLEGEAVVDGLVRALGAEWDRGVTEGMALAVDRAGGHAEELGVNAAELGDVVRDGAFRVCA